MSKSGLATLVAIIFGGAGFAGGYFWAKHKYEKLADKEVESMKAMQKEHDAWLLKHHGINVEPEQPTPTKPNNKPSTVTPNTVRPNTDRLAVEEAAKNNQRINYQGIASQYGGNKEVSQQSSDIHIISDAEFGESSKSYQTLYYFADGVVTDDENNPVANFTKLIGEPSLWSDKFDRFNAVYIRNTSLDMDYEILKREERWGDIASPAQKASMLNTVGEADDDN